MKRSTLLEGYTGYRLSSEERDLLDISPIIHAQILFSGRVIHEFEKALVKLQKRGLLWGALHPSFGMEIAASAALRALGQKSRINSTHRGHHHVLAKGLFALMDEDWNPLKSVDELDYYDRFIQYMKSICDEILGLRGGVCSGRGGSMHLYEPSVGVHGTNAIVGGAIPAAVGLAFGCKYNDSGEIVMSFFGDGAINQGTFHESCNLATVLHLPIIFYLENNQYAVGTSSKSVCAGDVLALRGVGYGMQLFQVDANDPLAVYYAITEARDKISEGGAPALIEAIGYRPTHHDSPLPGSAYGYRSKEEEKFWQAKDSYIQYPKFLMNQNIITEDNLRLLDSQIETILDEIFGRFNQISKIPSEWWPDEQRETRPYLESEVKVDPYERDLVIGMRSEGLELQNLHYVNDDWIKASAGQTMTYVEAISKITEIWLAKDDSVVVWGEDVANFNQGPYGATKGLMKQFPSRILNMPISESAFTGMGLGATMVGIKPIVEIMFPDFVLVAADQFFNQIAKARYMYGGSLNLPLVIRTRVATGTGMGPQHSMDLAALFSLFPGWRIIAPVDASQYVGLFNTAMVSNDPVLILEHHTLYSKKANVPVDLNYSIPFGSARVVKKGNQVTCIGYGGMIPKLIEAAQILANEISAEIIDLRSLDLPSIDYETILTSVDKTRSIVFFEETPSSQSIGKQILFNMLSASTLNLAHPPAVVCSLNVSLPVSRPLEQTAILSTEDIVTYLRGRRRK
ncbi:MAG: thiamine pyrophosphate-dependent enzyme [Sphaerochaetaceae bacterium]